MIYVVEDNSSIRQIIKVYLELADFQVVEFEGVKGVVESLAFKHPRLCILDVMLGDGNGFELAKQIHQHDPSIPFLFSPPGSLRAIESPVWNSVARTT